jgi:hypothetical protein
LTLNLGYELADFVCRGFGLLALNTKQETLELMVGEPCIQDAGENDRKRNNGYKDSGVLVKKSAARNARSRRCFLPLPWSSILVITDFCHGARIYSLAIEPAGYSLKDVEKTFT